VRFTSEGVSLRGRGRVNPESGSNTFNSAKWRRLLLMLGGEVAAAEAGLTSTLVAMDEEGGRKWGAFKRDFGWEIVKGWGGGCVHGSW
jgi:hypothetical protein